MTQEESMDEAGQEASIHYAGLDEVGQNESTYENEQVAWTLQCEKNAKERQAEDVKSQHRNMEPVLLHEGQHWACYGCVSGLVPHNTNSVNIVKCPLCRARCPRRGFSENGPTLPQILQTLQRRRGTNLSVDTGYHTRMSNAQLLSIGDLNRLIPASGQGLAARGRAGSSEDTMNLSPRQNRAVRQRISEEIGSHPPSPSYD